MRIVIAGAGDVGMYLARLLSIESQDIILIDENKKLLNKVHQELDIFTLNGDAGSPKILKDANVGASDLLIAVTSSEKTNLMVASFGKQLGAKFTIARVSNPEYLNKHGDLNMSSLGVDMVISPEDLAANEIASLVKRSLFTDTFEFAEGKMLLLGLHLDGSEPIVNKTIEETAILNPKDSFSCVAIQREGETIIPRGDTFFMRDDHAYFLAVEGSMAEVLKLTGREEHRIKNVMIMGGGKVGMCTIDKIKKRKKIKLIEQDPERCLKAADKYSDILVINDDGHNVKLLEDENIEEMDAFVAVTGNSETNIISCLVAKAHGVKKTIALVENVDYINLSQNIGIDTLINKKLIAANNIFKFVRRGEVLNIAGIHGVEAQVLEFYATSDSKVTKGAIKDLKFPKKAIIGGVIRNGEGKIVHGDDQVLPKDKVLVFAQTEAIKSVENFF